MIENFENLPHLFTGENIRTILTGLIAFASWVSCYNTWISWKKTNRPIVSASISTNAEGNISTMYDLVIVNSGNRPATDIRLKLDISIDNLKFLIEKDIDHPDSKSILTCFKEESMIPILLGGSSTSNWFGLTSERSDQNFWKYGSSLPIRILYKDLDGNEYTSQQTLTLKTYEAFAGAKWIGPEQ